MAKRRGAGDGTIALRKDGRWHARLRYVDPITKLAERDDFYGRTRDDVVAQLDEARRRLRSGQPARDESIVLTDFLKLWLSDVVKPTKRETTHRLYESIAENHLMPSRLGVLTLRELQQVQIQHVLVAHSKATVRIQQLCLIVLRQALEQAVKWHLLAVNPCVEIVAPKGEERELHVLSPAEAKRFLAAARGDRHYGLYYTAIDSGMREGELFALRWTDVDLDAGSIRVIRTLNVATGKVGPPKTKKSRRRIELAPAAIAVLREQRERLKAEGSLGALVFPSPTGAPLSPSNVRIRSFLPLQKTAGIDPPIRFHDLRHTCATLLLGAGVHPKIVSERLGHTTIAITMDLYQHVNPTMQREAATRIEAIINPSYGRQSRESKRRSGRKKARGV